MHCVVFVVDVGVVVVVVVNVVVSRWPRIGCMFASREVEDTAAAAAAHADAG